MGKEQDPVPVKRGTRAARAAGRRSRRTRLRAGEAGRRSRKARRIDGGHAQTASGAEVDARGRFGGGACHCRNGPLPRSESAKGQHPRQAPVPGPGPSGRTPPGRTASLLHTPASDLSEPRGGGGLRRRVGCPFRGEIQEDGVSGEDRLYAFMLGLAGKGEDLQNNASTLEAEMDRIFREALRTENIAVKVREIRSY